MTTTFPPYRQAVVQWLRLSDEQESILQLDVWSVHRSKEFGTWIQTEHPTILLEYVPGGCTGIFQPLDLALHCPLKLAIQSSQQANTIHEASYALKCGVAPESLTLDTSLTALHDRSVGWLVDAFDAVNKPEVVKKVCSFEYIAKLAT